MKILNRVGGAFLLAVLVIAAFIGFQSPIGRQIWNGLWQAGETVVSFVRQQVPQLGGRTDHDASLAIAISAVLVIVVIFLVGKPIPIRTFTILVAGATALAFVLYNPGIVG